MEAAEISVFFNASYMVPDSVRKNRVFRHAIIDQNRIQSVVNAFFQKETAPGKIFKHRVMPLPFGFGIKNFPVIELSKARNPGKHIHKIRADKLVRFRRLGFFKGLIQAFLVFWKNAQAL